MGKELGSAGGRVVAAVGLVTVTLSLLIGASPASALSQRGHVFAFSFGTPGKTSEDIREPVGVAVRDATGDVYVVDRKNGTLLQFRPTDGKSEQFVQSVAVKRPVGVAVDNSTGGSDPSAGDVYVVGNGGSVIYKLSPEGVKLAEVKHFALAEGGARERLEGITGIAVDGNGSVFVFQQDGVLYEFDDALANGARVKLPTGLTGAGGLALPGEGDYFAAIAGEQGYPVIAEVEAVSGRVLCDALDPEQSLAVAVNRVDVPENDVDEQGDVYVTNVTEAGGEPRTTVAQFGAGPGCAPLLQRFGAPGLRDGSGIAVDELTGAVYVADPASSKVYVFSLEEPGPPAVEALVSGAGAVPGAAARRLSARVDPSGSDTRSYIEYGPARCSSSPCTRGAIADLGAGFAGVEVSLEVDGLAPGLYHFRVTAENSFATGSAAVHSREGTFTVLTVSGGLPDGRAWEMVSPAEKGGAAIEALNREGGFVLAAQDGGAFTYVANGAISEDPQGNRSFEPQQVLAVRGQGGWSTQDIATPDAKAVGANFGAPEYQFFSPDLSVALVEPYDPEPPLAPEVTAAGIYFRDNPPLLPEATQRETYAQAQANSAFLAPGFAPLLNKTSAPEAHLPAQASFLDATPNLQHVVLESGSRLAGPSSAAGLYEWSQGGTLQFVSALPEGQPAFSVALGYYHTRARAISSDGSRVFWTTSQETPAHLYMRDLATSKTIQLDEAQDGISEPPGAAKFQTASADGSRAFFTDDQNLLPGATGEPQREVSDLYECEISSEDSCLLHDLTIPTRAGERAAVQGLPLGASEDGTTLYLVAHGVLADDENEHAEIAEPGHDNLYELHYQGGEWTTDFIAQLSGEDSPDWDQGKNVSDENTSFQTTRVSPDGRYLAFMSSSSLTGYDNEDATSEHPGERMDEEVFLYDSQTATITCVSCNPSGERPTGVLDQEHSGEGIGLLVDRRESWRGQWLSGNIPGWTAASLTGALVQSRYLSDDGRVFFDSASPLVPGILATTREEQIAGHSQHVGVENVYEYEPAGIGGCANASGSCIALLSGGSSSRESAFMEATPDGSEVFFLTAATLSPLDTDGAFDVYDARECTTASPCLPEYEPPPAPCSSTSSCHTVAGNDAVQPEASGTAALFGAGNLTQQPLAPAKQAEKGPHAFGKPATQAHKLANALKQCRRQHPRSAKKRKSCEAHARKLYGPRRSTHQPAPTMRGKR